MKLLEDEFHNSTYRSNLYSIINLIMGTKKEGELEKKKKRAIKATKHLENAPVVREKEKELFNRIYRKSLERAI